MSLTDPGREVKGAAAKWPESARPIDTSRRTALTGGCRSPGNAHCTVDRGHAAPLQPSRSTGLAVDAQRRNEIFVELEPDPVAGIHAGAVDPARFPSPGSTQRSLESCAVPVEPCEHCTELAGEWSQGSADGREFIEDSFVPRLVGMVILCKLVVCCRDELPVGARSLEAGVQREKVAVGTVNLLGFSGSGELLPKLAFILGTT